MAVNHHPLLRISEPPPGDFGEPGQRDQLRTFDAAERAVFFCVGGNVAESIGSSEFTSHVLVQGNDVVQTFRIENAPCGSFRKFFHTAADSIQIPLRHGRSWKNLLQSQVFISAQCIRFKIPVRIEGDHINGYPLDSRCSQYSLIPAIFIGIEQAVVEHQLLVNRRIAAVRHNNKRAAPRGSGGCI